ncbi:helix-turn-helix domain-containing protein [Clostridium paraputrificum]|uniref:helix-turn-helix domain-containing protein n=1 Tax=Clostridium TaxID=1485 RepID=UPI0006C70FE6|nr:MULTISPECIES: helix-turn-helix domain-containing protein [Clostridium]MDB2089395.1 helix-turn-helix domain-containing protein [Clostridium paraputrificum]MDB2096331.1 helix-turn-helix domain-containing protein [Clostridium paraputrificum]MDU1179998.1 helix-turn-helix domain-containing protein [Clostridium sp.]MDU1226942.1 helix-turn-helix domain-containing protein [Clostridium sp.]MDU7653127.1 helix-turn-helix domain-containing protein [Clostridium sp.]
MAIGKAILLMAKERNITKYRISKRSGVTQTTLGEITNGKNTNPTVETLEKIAIGIGIPLSELLRKAEELEKEEAIENE